MNKEIYCYKINEADLQLLNTITEALDITTYFLDDGMLKNTVQEILDHQANATSRCDQFDLSFMLLNNIDDEDLRTIHDQTAEKLTVDPVKMMVTEHNRQWQLAALFEEVSKEHRLFSNVEKIAALMKKLNDVDMSQWDNAKKESMKMTVMKAYILLNSGNFNEQNVEESLNELRELVGE